TDGRRLGSPRTPRRIPEAQVRHDGNVVFPPRLRTSRQRCSHAQPSCCRHARPHCSLLTVAVALVFPQIFLGDARQGGVRTNDIALSF
ncbi:hypothetical protein K438DRAFT_1873271, partial [Mycena galopus ATCC 62051]